MWRPEDELGMWPQRFMPDGRKKTAADYWAAVEPWLKARKVNKDVFDRLQLQFGAVDAYERGEMELEVLRDTMEANGSTFGMVDGMVKAIAKSHTTIKPPANRELRRPGGWAKQGEDAA